MKARSRDEGMAEKKKPRKKPRKFGKIRKLPSGRFQASYTVAGQTHYAKNLFEHEVTAENWLNDEQNEIKRAELYGEEWKPPAAREEESMTVKELIDLWLANSPTIKKESSRASHRRRLQSRVMRDSFPGFKSLANERVIDVDRKRIVRWWQEVQKIWPDQQVTNVGAYKNLHTAFEYAIDALDIIEANPVKIKGASALPKSKVKDRELVSVEEAKLIADNIYPRLRVPFLILQWCGLRLGELLELRRKDIIDKAGAMKIRVSRNAQRIKNPATNRYEMVPSTPKTEAGNRDVDVPPKIAVEVREHLKAYVDNDPEALFVTTENGKGYLDTSFRTRFKKAAEIAGRPDITPHDMRRFYGTMLVNNSGIDIDEARKSMGHETNEQVLEYQRARKNYGLIAATNLDKLIS